MFFFHNPETPQAMKLNFSDFKDTFLRHILQVIPISYILRCYQGNEITKKVIELKFGMESNFGPLNPKSHIELEFEVLMTS